MYLKFWQEDFDLEDNTSKIRVCPGHERALSIESTVMTLDVREEGKVHFVFISLFTAQAH